MKLKTRFSLIYFPTLFSILSIILGNLFWLEFTNSLRVGHFFTSAPLQIVISLALPIIIFGFYLASTLILSLLVENKIFWLMILLPSFFSYPFTLNRNFYDFLGGLGLVGVMFAFLFNYQRIKILVNKKTSIFSQASLAFSTVSWIMTIIIAFNFYGLYKEVLSSNQVIVSDQAINRSLRPLVALYMDDLGITKLNQTVTEYLTKRSRQVGETKDQVRGDLMDKLSLKSINENGQMIDLIRESLSNSVLKIINE